MRWWKAGLSALSLVLITGCPDGFGKGGRVDRAVRQDMLELHRKYCSEDDLERFCGGAMKNSATCIRMCGEQ